jgi:ornithine carbamoyltransferase
MKHFINIIDCTADQLAHLLTTAHALRQQREAGQLNTSLQGRTLAMYFEKPSLRTRVSFEQGMYELGGHAIVLGRQEIQLGQRESIADAVRVLGGMVQGLMARVFDHDQLQEAAKHSPIPVINALSDYSHPCQALADVMTMQDEFGEDLSGRHMVFVGDGNNVARSLATICAKLGMRFTLACPPGYALEPQCFELIRRQIPQAQLDQVHDAGQAVADADAIYCDTFVSMGQESEKQDRLRDFADYQVNEQLLGAAPDRAIVLHCLPAYRGVEITDEVMDGPASRVFQQAHNRLHAQKGLLRVLLGTD